MARALLLRRRIMRPNETRPTRRLRISLLAIALAVIAGCSSSSAPSSENFSDDDDAAVDAGVVVDAAPACAGPTPTQTSDACQQCQDTHCCITATAEQTHPDEWTKSAGLICREDNCATECGTAASKCGNITPSPASCLAAFDTTCCAELSACGASDECLALVYIDIDDNNCDPSQACFKTYEAQYPDGAKIFDAMNACGEKVNCQ
jgi:hypothetical protein